MSALPSIQLPLTCAALIRWTVWLGSLAVLFIYALDPRIGRKIAMKLFCLPIRLCIVLLKLVAEIVQLFEFLADNFHRSRFSKRFANVRFHKSNLPNEKGQR